MPNRTAVLDKTKQCLLCEKGKPFNPNEINLLWIESKHSFERLQMDITYPSESDGRGKQIGYTVSCRDNFSGYSWASYTKKRDAESVKKLLKSVVDEVGIVPDIVQYNQGSEGRGVFQDFVEEIGSKLIRSAVEHPQSNGGVERWHGIVKPVWPLLVQSNDKSFKVNIKEGVKQVNSTPNTITKLTPKEMFKKELEQENRWQCCQV